MANLFPLINTIEDVLPYIQDRPEIIVAEKDGYKVINYVVATPELFRPTDHPVRDRMILECRGLIFDNDGKLISRPLNKFFNVNEKEWTQADALDFTDHAVYDKVDGSMVRPLFLKGGHRLATKMGVTDTSMNAETWMTADEERYLNFVSFFNVCREQDITPIFEWVSRDNKIVIAYDEPDLILLAMRHLHSGYYFSYDVLQSTGQIYDLSVVKRFDLFDTISNFISKTKSEIGNEGYIIELRDGDRVKIKTDEYTRIHKIKEKVQQPRHIVALILDEQIDDVKASLDAYDVKKVEDVETDYYIWLNRRINEIDRLWEMVRIEFEDKRDFAINTSETNKFLRRFMFSKFDGKDTREIVLDLVRQNIGGDKRYQEFLDEYFAR